MKRCACSSTVTGFLGDGFFEVFFKAVTCVNIESSFQFGWTPLMCAASVADSAVVRLLLDRGANASFAIDKYTVLMAACAANTSEEKVLKTVELLLSRNADPNLTCRRQMTPLMYAAQKGYSQVVALLVAHGAHINAQDDNGYSALIWAAQHGHKNVTLKLLELGADKNLQTKDEKTAAEIAKINKYSELYNLLSLAANHFGLLLTSTIFVSYPICSIFSSYSTFNDMEVFLQGLGLGHVIGLFKVSLWFIWYLLSDLKNVKLKVSGQDWIA
uniref:Uncharacterized protein n=1 Tax=Melopsittacus undulatus TaxID=13146 RepID=A0A8C6K4F8_MELUD